MELTGLQVDNVNIWS